MAYINQLPESATIVDGYVHLEIIDPAEPTGYKSYKIKLEDFAGGTGSGGVETYANYAAFPVSGTVDILYIALDTYYSYVWNSGAYHQTSVVGDMILSAIQSVTGLKTFDKDKIAIKGTSTGINTVSVANTSASNYTNTIPAKNGTFAMTDDISVLGYFDATIGTGGEYSDIAAAQTAGKYRLKAVGNVTISTNTTITNNITIDLNGYTMICSSYVITITSPAILYLNSGIITFSYSSILNLFAQTTKYCLVVENCYFKNTSSVDSTSIAIYGTFNNCTVEMPNHGGGAFGSGAANSSFKGYLNNITIIGAGSSCYGAIYNILGDISVTNITFTGIWYSATEITIMASASNFIVNLTSGSITFCCTNLVNVKCVSGNIILRTTGSNTYPCIYSNCDFHSIAFSVTNLKILVSNSTCLAAFSLDSYFNYRVYFDSVTFTSTVSILNGQSGVINATFSTCLLQSTMTLNSDYCKLIGNTHTGLLTIGSGSEYNIITGNTFTAGLTDNSTSSTNIIKDNI